MILRLEGLVILILSYISTPCRADSVAIDDQDPSVSYNGQWTHWKRGAANTPPTEQAIGASVPSNINTISYTSAPSSPATVIFQGTSISIIAIKAKIGGSISVMLDGTPMQNADLSGTSNAPETVWTSPQLPNGTHSLSVAKVVTSDPKTQGTYVNIVYFSVEQPSPPSTPPPSNSNPAANSQPLASAADTTANQESTIAPDAPDASALPSSSSPSLSASNQSSSPSSALSGNTPLISNGQAVSPGNFQQNATPTYNSPGSTGTGYVISPPGVTSSFPGSTDVAASILKPPSSKTLVAVAGTLGGIAAVAIIILAYVFLRRRKERKIRELRRLYGCSEKTGMSDPQMDRDIELLQRKMDPDAPPSYPGHSHAPSGVALGEAF